MNDAGRLTFKIIRDLDANHRFRWLIYDEGRAVAYSPNSFAARREAEAGVGKAMLKLAVLDGGMKGVRRFGRVSPLQWSVVLVGQAALRSDLLLLAKRIDRRTARRALR